MEAAGITDALPLGGTGPGVRLRRDRTTKDGEYPLSFRARGERWLYPRNGNGASQGRDFNARDTPASTPVILINVTLRDRLWPGQDPIGQLDQGTCGKERQLVGVFGDVRHLALEKSSGSEMYHPHAAV